MSTFFIGPDEVPKPIMIEFDDGTKIFMSRVAAKQVRVIIEEELVRTRALDHEHRPKRKEGPDVC